MSTLCKLFKLSDFTSESWIVEPIITQFLRIVMNLRWIQSLIFFYYSWSTLLAQGIQHRGLISATYQSQYHVATNANKDLPHPKVFFFIYILKYNRSINDSLKFFKFLKKQKQKMFRIPKLTYTNKTKNKNSRIRN